MYRRGAVRREGGDGGEMSKNPTGSRSAFLLEYSFPPPLAHPIPNPRFHTHPFAGILWHERAKQLD